MIDKDAIQREVESVLEGTDKFVVEIKVEVTFTDGTVFSGNLVAADKDKISVYRKTKVKKVETEETKEILLTEIKHTKEVISFK